MSQFKTTPDIGAVIYSNNNYLIQVISHLDPESGATVVVYGVINTITGVREAELRSYSHAIKWADELSTYITKMDEEKEEESTLREALGTELTDEQYKEEQEGIDSVVEAPAMSREDAADLLDA